MAASFQDLRRDFSDPTCEEATKERLEAWKAGRKDVYLACSESGRTPELQYSEEFRSFHLWKRLYGDAIFFNGPGNEHYYYFPKPNTWKPYVKPSAPIPRIELDDWLEQRLAEGGKSLRERLIALGVDCAYWWMRWAIFVSQRFVDAVYMDYRLSDPKLLAQNLDGIIAHADSSLESLSALYRIFSESNISVLAHSQRHMYAEGSNKFMHGIVEGGIYGAFDLSKISEVKRFMSVLLLSASEWRSLINPKGRPSAVRRKAFAVYAGSIYYVLTETRPTETDGGGFHDFMSLAESVFWSDWGHSLEFPE